jgi:hypothetical protein
VRGHRQQRHDARAATDQQRGAPVLHAPDEVSADRAEDLERLAHLGGVVEPRRDLAFGQALDAELVHAIALGGESNE